MFDQLIWSALLFLVMAVIGVSIGALVYGWWGVRLGLIYASLVSVLHFAFMQWLVNHGTR